MVLDQPDNCNYSNHHFKQGRWEQAEVEANQISWQAEKQKGQREVEIAPCQKNKQ
ncbi:MAG: hypothetical protein AAB963_01235 [Patescibacteria group bacterium]